MADRTPNALRLFYALAVVAGLCGLPFVLALADHVVTYGLADYLRGLPPGSYDRELVAGTVVAAFHAVLGAAFGFVRPEVGWRWGVWLTAPAVCLGSFLAPPAWVLAAWAGLALLPGRLGARLAARLHLSYVGAG